MLRELRWLLGTNYWGLRVRAFTPVILHAQRWWRVRTVEHHCTWCWQRSEPTRGAHPMELGPR